MSELLLFYSGNIVFYAKVENGRTIFLFDYTADIGKYLIAFLEDEPIESPYSFLPGYEAAEELKAYLKDYVNGLLCTGINFLDLEGNKVKGPRPIELLELDESFKKDYTIRHMVCYKNNGDFEIKMGYVVTNLSNALFIELVKLIESKKLLKVCEHCKRIFLPKDGSEKYCDRTTKNGKTCKDIGYLFKVENDELLKAYNTAYKTRHAEKQRKTRGKSKNTVQAFENALENWRKAAREQLEKAQKGEITVEEFKNFLKTRLKLKEANNHGKKVD